LKVKPDETNSEIQNRGNIVVEQYSINIKRAKPVFKDLKPNYGNLAPILRHTHKTKLRMTKRNGFTSHILEKQTTTLISALTPQS